MAKCIQGSTSLAHPAVMFNTEILYIFLEIDFRKRNYIAILKSFRTYSSIEVLFNDKATI